MKRSYETYAGNQGDLEVITDVREYTRLMRLLSPKSCDKYMYITALVDSCMYTLRGIDCMFMVSKERSDAGRAIGSPTYDIFASFVRQLGIKYIVRGKKTDAFHESLGVKKIHEMKPPFREIINDDYEDDDISVDDDGRDRTMSSSLYQDIIEDSSEEEVPQDNAAICFVIMYKLWLLRQCDAVAATLPADLIYYCIYPHLDHMYRNLVFLNITEDYATGVYGIMSPKRIKKQSEREFYLDHFMVDFLVDELKSGLYFGQFVHGRKYIARNHTMQVVPLEYAIDDQPDINNRNTLSHAYCKEEHTAIYATLQEKAKELGFFVYMSPDIVYRALHYEYSFLLIMDTGIYRDHAIELIRREFEAGLIVVV